MAMTAQMAMTLNANGNDNENGNGNDNENGNGDKADRPLVCILFISYQLFRVLLVVVGFIFQLLTCFRRDRISISLTPIPNTTNNER